MAPWSMRARSLLCACALGLATAQRPAVPLTFDAQNSYTTVDLNDVDFPLRYDPPLTLRVSHVAHGAHTALVERQRPSRCTRDLICNAIRSNARRRRFPRVSKGCPLHRIAKHAMRYRVCVGWTGGCIQQLHVVWAAPHRFAAASLLDIPKLEPSCGSLAWA